MKPYGLPRNDDVEHPDAGDIRDYGRKSSTGAIKGKNGDYRSAFRSVSAKARARRYWKKFARRSGAAEVRNGYHNHVTARKGPEGEKP